jgi:hypothetical protein
MVEELAGHATLVASSRPSGKDGSGQSAWGGNGHSRATGRTAAKGGFCGKTLSRVRQPLKPVTCVRSKGWSCYHSYRICLSIERLLLGWSHRIADESFSTESAHSGHSSLKAEGPLSAPYRSSALAWPRAGSGPDRFSVTRGCFKAPRKPTSNLPKGVAGSELGEGSTRLEIRRPVRERRRTELRPQRRVMKRARRSLPIWLALARGGRGLKRTASGRCQRALLE